MHSLLAIMVGLAAVALCTTLHYEAIRSLDLRLRKNADHIRRHIPSVILAIMALHLLEIAIYAFAFWVVLAKLGVGGFTGGAPATPAEFYALAAESYTSFGYGDIVPTGWLRFVVSLSPINGLLLIAWSGAFLYGAVHQRQAG